MITLHKEFEGLNAFVARVRNIKGNIIADYSDINMSTRIKIASDSTLVIWGVKGAQDNRITFVSILDSKGKVISTHEYPNKEGWIDDILSSQEASNLLLIEHIWGKQSPDKVRIWNTKINSLTTIPISDDLGVIAHERDISFNGAFAVLKLGGKAISLIDTVQGSEILHKSINDTLSDGYHFEQILRASVTDKGNILVMGHSKGVVGYCVLDKTGKIIQSKILEDFGNDANIMGDIKIQDLGQDKFAIVHKTNKIEIIDLK